MAGPWRRPGPGEHVRAASGPGLLAGTVISMVGPPRLILRSFWPGPPGCVLASVLAGGGVGGCAVALFYSVPVCDSAFSVCLAPFALVRVRPLMAGPSLPVSFYIVGITVGFLPYSLMVQYS